MYKLVCCKVSTCIITISDDPITLGRLTVDDVQNVYHNFTDHSNFRTLINRQKSFRASTRGHFSADNETNTCDTGATLCGGDVYKSCLADVESTVPYTAVEMLEKKEKRGKPSPAQLYFRNLLRDAAVSAAVWEHAPTLGEITVAQRIAFFKAFEAAPELLLDKRELWRRLGESLQNRRKYLLDKGKGKRL